MSVAVKHSQQADGGGGGVGGEGGGVGGEGIDGGGGRGGGAGNGVEGGGTDGAGSEGGVGDKSAEDGLWMIGTDVASIPGITLARKPVVAETSENKASSAAFTFAATVASETAMANSMLTLAAVIVMVISDAGLPT